MDYTFKSTLIISGIIQFVTYTVAAFLMTEVDITVKLQKA